MKSVQDLFKSAKVFVKMLESKFDYLERIIRANHKEFLACRSDEFYENIKKLCKGEKGYLLIRYKNLCEFAQEEEQKLNMFLMKNSKIQKNLGKRSKKPETKAVKEEIRKIEHEKSPVEDQAIETQADRKEPETFTDARQKIAAQSYSKYIGKRDKKACDKDRSRGL